MIRLFATLFGVVAFMVAAVGLAVRYVPLGRHSVLLAATASPYLMMAAPVAVLLLALSRRWVRPGHRCGAVRVGASARTSADVVVLQELTQEAADGLAAAGLDDTFGHRIINPEPMAGGIVIWSRFPLADTAHVPGYSLAMVRARLQIPQVAVNPIVVGIHFAAPRPAMER